ncbi:MAG: hypothetical protein IKU15_02420 [Clostridia bacterium]|nr:hypothetical protein [Clostridia bacterium]
MEKGKLYVVLCRQGRRKDECPLAWHCVECSYAVYQLREYTAKQEEVTEEIKEENIDGQR